jgi:hypothetical protein
MLSFSTRECYGDVVVPLVSSPSSCCASNLPQAGPVDQADRLGFL